MNQTSCVCVAALLLAALACSPQGASGPSASDTLFVRFGLDYDPDGSLDFLAPTSRASLIDSVRQELSRPVDQVHRHFHGWIRPAGGGENLDWPWAVEPGVWTLAEVSYELCDGLPSQVEDRREACPWASYVKDTTWGRPN
jgi:hypothetical protein